MSALWPATAGNAQRRAGDDSTQPALPVSLRRRRLSPDVQPERHREAPRVLSTSLLRLSAEDAGELSVERKVCGRADTVQIHSTANQTESSDVLLLTVLMDLECQFICEHGGHGQLLHWRAVGVNRVK